ncbi:MAG TPA: hypothetical protein VJT09_13685 [Pyrinomonadaceae bacterium]|nr:hypothetical protein [Pyrinomonadaceae bacterium]
MNESFGSTPMARHQERGASRLKFIVVLAVVALITYMGFQYVPVAYNYSRYKSLMQDSADKAAVTGQGTEWVRTQLQASAKDYGVPPDAQIIPAVREGRLEVTVKFTRPVNLLPGIWNYNYDFDHTVKSTDLFAIK